MFELLSSSKTGGFPGPSASLRILLKPNLSISKRQFCAISLRNGCRLGLGDAPGHVNFHRRRYAEVSFCTLA